MRLTRKIQQCEIEMYNPTRPTDDKFANSDYMCKRSAYDRDILNKLGQLEDIEEELGIDLITLFKALKNGIYEKIKPDKKNKNPEPRFWSYEELSLGYQWYSNEYEATQDDITIYEGYNFGLIVSGELFNLKDYGRTWALTKEELE